MKQLVIVSDLDGTLLDDAYSFEAAIPALNLLEKKGIPLVLCSSKTRTEIELYRQRLGNRHPFISENGGGIFIPQDYFPPHAFHDTLSAEVLFDYRVIRLGAPYEALRHALIELRRKGFEVTGFGDLDIDTIGAATGLSPEEAALAQQRDFDEPFFFDGSRDEEYRLTEEIHRLHLHLTQGRLRHLLGNSDKGRAVAILLNCWRSLGHDLLAVGLGDQLNDFPLLQQVDIPVLIRRPDGTHVAGCALPNLRRTEKIGPQGWNEAVLEIVATLNDGVAR